MHTKRPSRILIIEDDPADREVYRQCLRQSNGCEFEFAEAACGGTGIQVFRTWRPDCLLLDFNLPDLDGIEVLAQIRDHSGRVPCAVVMLTAFGCEELAVKAMKAGAMDYLPKGQVTVDALRQTIVNAMERFQMQERIETQRTALEESGRRYQVLLEAIPEMVWTANAEGRVLYANSHWLEYTGLKLADAARLGWDRLLHPDDRERTWSAWDLASKSGSALEVEHRLRRAKDGCYRWHLARAVPMRAMAGESTTWFGTCTDVEDQKQTERALRQKQHLEGIGMLAAGVAHDFNNLLGGILGGASYAMDSLPAAHPVQPMLQIVVQASERAAGLTRKMLAYAGKGAFVIELMDFGRLVGDTCREMQQSSIPQTIALELHDGDDLPLVFTDPAQLRQMVVELVTNAVEAIGEGASGTISVQTAAVDLSEQAGECGIKPGRYVALEVRDTGCGMDEETQPKIFDPFFSTKFIGRGLGLAAVQGFVRSNGGGVQVESSPGRGSCFRVLLPAGGAGHWPATAGGTACPTHWE